MAQGIQNSVEAALSENALSVLEARYLRRDAEFRIVETPDEMFRRVCRAIAAAEANFSGEVTRWEEEFYLSLRSLEFLPNSPALMNAGTPLGQLSACFVLAVPDSIPGIFEALKRMAITQCTGGGTGLSFSDLRPSNDLVASTGGRSSGPVSFMRIFDCATENIKQGGKRRGANMGILRVDHPDILDFIQAKLDQKSFANFNLSIGITDAYMQAYWRNETYALIHPRTGRTVSHLPARQVFQAIIGSAWHTGDPGLVFLDTINRHNPTPHLGSIEATNPCGEVPLLPNESCNLGSINLARMLAGNEHPYAIAWDKLGATVRRAVRFLDNMIEVNRFLFPEVEQMARGNRKIGLGVMGFAEMLVSLGISYDSDEAASLAEELMRFISEEARRWSRELADERGSFLNWRGSVYEGQNLKMRNATRTAIAPTGTIGIIAGTSASIEPFFALAYRRAGVFGEQQFFELNPLLATYMERHGLDPEPVLEALREQGRLATIPGVPDEVKRLFVTALEIPVDRHLQVQAAFQRHVDNSVSKTINLSAQASIEDVEHAYLRAWEMELKGITVYRYGSKSPQVLELGLLEKTYEHNHASKCDPHECRV